MWDHARANFARSAPRIVDAIESGSSIRAAARRFAVSPSAAIKLMQRVRTTGSAALARYGGHRRPLLEHKVDGVREAIAAAGASLLYLPPYSPDLNPIEQLFAKLKALLRKAAARTKEELWQAIGRLLAAVPPSECTYLDHCGYGST